MLKAYKFRLYPEKVQISKINSFIDSSRFVYRKKYNEDNINYTVFNMKKDLDKAYDNLFNKLSGYPNYKKKRMRQSP